jgi:UPF0271 protein
MLSIDLNCDMGESFGAWTMGNDAELMNYVSSINIACGFHAGDPTVIRKTVETAIKKEIAIGGHPSFPDLQGFGRRQMSVSPSEIYDIVLYQIGAIKGFCDSLGGNLHHIKPHGALYNQAAKDKNLAKAISQAVFDLDKSLILYGLAGSFLISEAEKIGLKTGREVFADRTYQPDGNLTPRSENNALITDTEKAVAQVLQMVREKTVTATNGEKVNLQAETVCIHGDGRKALGFAKEINHQLKKNGILVKTI